MNQSTGISLVGHWKAEEIGETCAGHGHTHTVSPQGIGTEMIGKLIAIEKGQHRSV